MPEEYKVGRLARDLAREYLDEPDNASAEALGRRLARLARGRAILVDDQVILPHPTGRLAILPVWDVDLEGVDVEGAAAELAALASGARPVVVPYDSPRRRSFVGRVICATGCTEAEAIQVVDDMELPGFAGDAGQFREMAHALLLRHRAMEADPARTLDPRD